MTNDRIIRFYRATTTHNNQKCSVCGEIILANTAFVHVGHPMLADVCVRCADEMHTLLANERSRDQRARGQDWVQLSLF